MGAVASSRRVWIRSGIVAHTGIVASDTSFDLWQMGSSPGNCPFETVS